MQFKIDRTSSGMAEWRLSTKWFGMSMLWHPRLNSRGPYVTTAVVRFGRKIPLTVEWK